MAFVKYDVHPGIADQQSPQYHADTLFNFIDGTLKQKYYPGKKYTVGKSYVDAAGSSTFDSNNPDTWNKTGIESRARDYFKKHYDGMIVFYCITQNQVPTVTQELAGTTQMPNNLIQRFALLMENSLISKYQLKAEKASLNQCPYTPGNLSKNHKGYVLYVAHTSNPHPHRPLTDNERGEIASLPGGRELLQRHSEDPDAAILEFLKFLFESDR